MVSVKKVEEGGRGTSWHIIYFNSTQFAVYSGMNYDYKIVAWQLDFQ